MVKGVYVRTTENTKNTGKWKRTPEYCNRRSKELKGKCLNTGRTHFKKGVVPSTAFKKGCIGNRKGAKCSNEFRKKLSLAHKGKRSGAWKGGITPIITLLRTSDKYKQWRSSVFQRDNWICQTCGVRGVYMEAHHIKEFAKIFYENNIKTFQDGMNCNELWDTNNGVTLCKDCHNLTKKGGTTFGKIHCGP